MIGLDKPWIDEVCKMGQDGDCCSFLGFGAPEGFICLKGTAFEAGIFVRRSEETMVAMGDNCSGPPSFEKEGFDSEANIG